MDFPDPFDFWEYCSEILNYLFFIPLNCQKWLKCLRFSWPILIVILFDRSWKYQLLFQIYNKVPKIYSNFLDFRCPNHFGEYWIAPEILDYLFRILSKFQKFIRRFWVLLAYLNSNKFRSLKKLSFALSESLKFPKMYYNFNFFPLRILRILDPWRNFQFPHQNSNKIRKMYYNF